MKPYFVFAARPAGQSLTRRSRLIGQIAAVFAGVLFLAASSYIEVPMRPVPITMQTFAVALLGAVFGARLGAVTVLVWLGQSALGMPFLSGGAGGFLNFFGPTGGYLMAFPLSAFLAGFLAARGWGGASLPLAFANMFICNSLCLALGGAWLASFIGLKQGFMLGIAPFLLGDALKAMLAALALKLLPQGWRGR